MDREQTICAILERPAGWDVLIIGGGATGLGAAVDAAARGYRTVLLEQHDFAKGTSSRSTKLVHGGVRYLRQGNISLVREGLHERAGLLRHAPHLTRPQAFLVATYSRFDSALYGIGLKMYDALSGQFSLGPSRIISREEALRELPNVKDAGLRGGVRYFDGQFDDARLALCLAQTVFDLGGTALNYAPVIRLLKDGERVCGVVARDAESGREFELRARVVINATGVFTDAVRKMDSPGARPLVTASQGAHIVVDRKFFPGQSALMIPKTADDRVLFTIPWQNHVVIGTTDVPVRETPLEPRPLAQEVEFLLEHAAHYLVKAPGERDILSAFAGLRPLVNASATENTARLSREHTIEVSRSGLVTITGGKWTTYRRMAEDVVNKAAEIGALPKNPCATHELRLHGAPAVSVAAGDSWSCYGSESEQVKQLAAQRSDLGLPLHPRLPQCGAHVVWAVRKEMARTIEDFLARRTRALFLEARAAIEAAPRVAELMAAELGRDPAWRQQEVKAFTEIAQNFLWK
jgi:glycerol-3-phosphate dehydrogenase